MKILSFSTRVNLESLKIGQDGGNMESIRTVLTQLLHSEERDPQRINNLMKKLVDKFERLQKSRDNFLPDLSVYQSIVIDPKFQEEEWVTPWKTFLQQMKKV